NAADPHRPGAPAERGQARRPAQGAGDALEPAGVRFADRRRRARRSPRQARPPRPTPGQARRAPLLRRPHRGGGRGRARRVAADRAERLAQGEGLAPRRACPRRRLMAADAARHRRLMDLFDEVCDLGAAERAARLVALRAEDPALADDLARLLSADKATVPNRGLELGAAALLQGESVPPPTPLRQPERVGRYRI